MKDTGRTELTPLQLMELAEAALNIAGTPAFASADYDGEIDSLQFIEADEVDESTWAFVPIPLDEEGNPHMGCDCCDHSEEAGGPRPVPSDRGASPAIPRAPRRRIEGDESRPDDRPPSGDDEPDDSEGLDDQILPLDTSLAAELIQSHFREWLAERGWQVQLEMFKKERRWRLADCLSFADGGGDRLDGDYPAGDDELRVLCESVVAVSRDNS